MANLELLISSNLGRLDGADLGEPTHGGLHLAHRTEFVCSIAWDSNVVGAFQNKLDVADLKDLGTTRLGDGTGRVEEVVDERVSHGENGLKELVSGSILMVVFWYW